MFFTNYYFLLGTQHSKASIQVKLLLLGDSLVAVCAEEEYGGGLVGGAGLAHNRNGLGMRAVLVVAVYSFVNMHLVLLPVVLGCKYKERNELVTLGFADVHFGGVELLLVSSSPPERCYSKCK